MGKNLTLFDLKLHPYHLKIKKIDQAVSTENRNKFALNNLQRKVVYTLKSFVGGEIILMFLVLKFLI